MSDGNTAAVDYRAVLRDMVAQLLTERVPWHAFENTFNWYYHFFIPELEDGDEADFFDFVNELLTWTGTAPTAEERGYGWRDESQAIAEIRERWEKTYGGESPHRW